MMSIAAYAEKSRSENNNPPVHIFSTGFRDPSVAELGARTARVAALGEMTGGIVHDFRNIFAVVESGLRLAAKSFSEPEKARAYIAEARNGIERGQRLASQLLTFGKMPERAPRASDVNVLLTQLEPFLRCGTSPGVRIVLALQPVPQCLIDQSQFAAAILNLVLNARDAMPNGGDVYIGTQAFAAETALSDGRALGAHVRIRVSDSGLGMPAAVLERIFDPFFTTKGESGTGLGLSQVSACMRLHGGHITVASRIGSGTVVDLLFPFDQPSMNGAVNTTAVTSKGDFDGAGARA
jgi:signal transduction histidine kinase